MLRLALLTLTGLLAAAPACERSVDSPDVPGITTGTANGEPRTSYPEPKWRGMTFAHEGYDGLTGYGGPSVGPSLDSLTRLAVDAVAIVPYTYMPGAREPTPLPIPDRLGTETDRAVRAAIDSAHVRGLRVLLKPQIWVRGAWPGEIDFDSPEEWSAFLAHYRTWMLHYAELARETDVDALCIGTELTRATLEHPGFWRKLTGEVRERYPGIVTYAANWGAEFEGIAFWDALDAVGLNAYYPLSQNPDATDDELLTGARAWMRTADAVAERAGRPLWLTEVGFRSARRAWLHPHAAADGRAVSEECQARCFAALHAAADESERLAAAFVWKWPSWLGYVGGGSWDGVHGDPGTGFSPGGKAAAAELTKWYAGWR